MRARNWLWVFGLAVCVVVGLAPNALGQDIESKGRAILEKNQAAVVTIQLVIKQKFSMSGAGSQEDESKQEATGVVITPDGLTVLALSTTDPTSIYENMMAGMEGMGDKFKMESNLSDVKILLGDGTEIPAKIVLRDKDLDLAFVRPATKPAQPMAALDLSQSGEPQVLDPLIALNRLGRVAGRAYCASIERVHAVVRKPRTFYVPGNDPTHSGLGSPLFTLDGKIVGIITLRTIKTGSAGLGGMMGSLAGGMDDSMLAIVVPADDIKEAASQAPEDAVEAPPEPAEQAPEGVAATPPVPQQNQEVVVPPGK